MSSQRLRLGRGVGLEPVPVADGHPLDPLDGICPFHAAASSSRRGSMAIVPFTPYSAALVLASSRLLNETSLPAPGARSRAFRSPRTPKTPTSTSGRANGISVSHCKFSNIIGFFQSYFDFFHKYFDCLSLQSNFLFLQSRLFQRPFHG